MNLHVKEASCEDQLSTLTAIFRPRSAMALVEALFSSQSASLLLYQCYIWVYWQDPAGWLGQSRQG